MGELLTYKMTHSHAYWQKGSVSYQRDLSIGLLEGAHDMVAAIPTASDVRQKGRSWSALVT